MPKASVPESTARLRFSKEGPLAAYYSVSESGFDRNPPAAEIKQGVEIIREFIDAAGKPITQVKVGQEFFVRLRVRATQRDRILQIAVVDLLPGGVEPVLELAPPVDTANAGADPAVMRGATGTGSLADWYSGQKSNWTPEHIDVRDDRVILYGDATRSAQTFVYRVNATNAGVFQSPPAFVEGMYDRSGERNWPFSGKLEIMKP